MGTRISALVSKSLLSLMFLLGIGGGECLAPETPPDPPAGARAALAEQFLHDKLALWQNRLKLQDWNVFIKMAHPTNLRQGTLGSIHWDAEKKSAVIRVLHASDYQMPYRAALNDMEFTIVHELIHLEFANITRSEASRTEEEFAVNHMADALLKLDREDGSVRPKPLLTKR